MKLRKLVRIVAAVVCAAGLTAFWLGYSEWTTDHVENDAVVDTEATNEVQSAVRQALVRVLSYDHSDPAPTQRAADKLLAGQARDEYDLLFKNLQERAPGQKLVLTTQVRVAAVKELRADSAKLLVFLDQASQRASDKEASVSAAQLAVDAEKVNGTWKVVGLKPL